MCGIIGYIGERPTTEMLITGLRSLEYRGYDSAGIAVVGGSGLKLLRSEGKLDNLTRHGETVALPSPVVGLLPQHKTGSLRPLAVPGRHQQAGGRVSETAAFGDFLARRKESTVDTGSQDGNEFARLDTIQKRRPADLLGVGVG